MTSLNQEMEKKGKGREGKRKVKTQEMQRKKFSSEKVAACK